jgi:ribosome modulation factor
MSIKREYKNLEYDIAILEGRKAARIRSMDLEDCPYGVTQLMERCAWLAAFRDERPRL